MPKYKLVVTSSWWKTKSRKASISRSFVWENKEDALACKELMSKATSAEVSVKFVEFTEEVDL